MSAFRAPQKSGVSEAEVGGAVRLKSGLTLRVLTNTAYPQVPV
jgi:hypothetical protein